MINRLCNVGRSKRNTLWPNSVNGKPVTIIADPRDNIVNAHDGRCARQKGILVRNENISANCVNELAINKLVCSVAGLYLKKANIIKSKGELTSPKRNVTKLISFMEYCSGFCNS